MTYRPRRLRFGIFVAPFHAIGDNPTLALERDMELIEFAERLDFDEAWIGEHHSAGAEIIGSPDLFIAGVAPRTHRIRLGTGVVSLSYHNPFIVADRMAQLDHQTRGRIMFGVGPGQLPGDAFMMGVSPARQRAMMEESIEAIIPLLEGEAVTVDRGWFKLDDARLQVLPYQEPRMEMAITCTWTPNGPKLAGQHGLSMLSVAATTSKGFAALPDHWRICEQVAGEHGRSVDRASWRVVAPIHVAPTREEAFADLCENIMPFITYLRAVGGKPMHDALGGIETPEQAVKLWATEGIGTFGVLKYGTPDDAAKAVEDLLDQSGGFGRFLLLAHNAANWQATQRSYELFARHVFPRFQHSDRRLQSQEHAFENHEKFIGAMLDAFSQTLDQHKDLLNPGPSDQEGDAS
ncbi:MAG: LLM class flavin-dependent oxidoreductase [Novosphingobium sp.]|nr:LLM class flavin-dependent oxidoreductase [Novosphingobium sp.]